MCFLAPYTLLSFKAVACPLSTITWVILSYSAVLIRLKASFKNFLPIIVISSTKIHMTEKCEIFCCHFPLPCSVNLRCAFGGALSVVGDDLCFLAYKEFSVVSKSAPTLLQRTLAEIKTS